MELEDILGSLIIFLIVAAGIIFMHGVFSEDEAELEKFKAAVQAGLVQKVDSASGVIYWTKP